MDKYLSIGMVNDKVVVCEVHDNYYKSVLYSVEDYKKFVKANKDKIVNLWYDGIERKFKCDTEYSNYVDMQDMAYFLENNRSLMYYVDKVSFDGDEITILSRKDVGDINTLRIGLMDCYEYTIKIFSNIDTLKFVGCECDSNVNGITIDLGEKGKYINNINLGGLCVNSVCIEFEPESIYNGHIETLTIKCNSNKVFIDKLNYRCMDNLYLTIDNKAEVILSNDLDNVAELWLDYSNLSKLDIKLNRNLLVLVGNVYNGYIENAKISGVGAVLRNGSVMFNILNLSEFTGNIYLKDTTDDDISFHLNIHKLILNDGVRFRYNTFDEKDMGLCMLRTVQYIFFDSVDDYYKNIINKLKRRVYIKRGLKVNIDNYIEYDSAIDYINEVFYKDNSFYNKVMLMGKEDYVSPHNKALAEVEYDVMKSLINGDGEKYTCILDNNTDSSYIIPMINFMVKIYKDIGDKYKDVKITKQDCVHVYMSDIVNGIEYTIGEVRHDGMYRLAIFRNGITEFIAGSVEKHCLGDVDINNKGKSLKCIMDNIAIGDFIGYKFSSYRSLALINGKALALYDVFDWLVADTKGENYYIVDYYNERFIKVEQLNLGYSVVDIIDKSRDEYSDIIDDIRISAI